MVDRDPRRRKVSGTFQHRREPNGPCSSAEIAQDKNHSSQSSTKKPTNEDELPKTLWRRLRWRSNKPAKYYYWNKATNETTWKPPADWTNHNISSSSGTSSEEDGLLDASDPDWRDQSNHNDGGTLPVNPCRNHPIRRKHRLSSGREQYHSNRLRTFSNVLQSNTSVRKKGKSSIGGRPKNTVQHNENKHENNSQNVKKQLKDDVSKQAHKNNNQINGAPSAKNQSTSSTPRKEKAEMIKRLALLRQELSMLERKQLEENRDYPPDNSKKF